MVQAMMACVYVYDLVYQYFSFWMDLGSVYNRVHGLKESGRCMGRFLVTGEHRRDREFSVLSMESCVRKAGLTAVTKHTLTYSIEMLFDAFISRVILYT